MRHRVRALGRTLLLVLVLGALTIAGIRGDLAIPTTLAGFTDSTYGAATLTTTSAIRAEAVGYDQSAASALFLTPAGTLYLSGYRGTGDGNGGRPGPTRAPTRVDVPESSSLVDAGGSTNDMHAANANTTSFMALDADGRVWTWGQPYGGSRLIGRGRISPAQSRTIGQVTSTAEGGSLPPIARMARTENQFLALDHRGTLWAWGYGSENLPNPTGNDDAPLPIRANHTTASPSGRACTGNSAQNLGEVPFRSVWSGTNAGGAVGQNGLVYTWGFDNSDGVGGGAISTLCPALNEGANRALFQRFPELYATRDGKTYDEQELTSERDRHSRYTDIVEDVRDRTLAECSGVLGSDGVDPSACPVRQLGFSAGAARLLTRDGELLTWATKPSYGRQFLGRSVSDRAPVNWPAPVEGGLRFRSVTTGVSSVLAVGTDGRAYGWGANNICQAVGATTSDSVITDGDCGAGERESRETMVLTPTPVEGIPAGAEVEQISATQCAAWATLTDGTTYAWGAGTAAGHSYNECRQPGSSYRGYKIYRATSDGDAPFGDPITAVATATVRTTRRPGLRLSP